MVTHVKYSSSISAEAETMLLLTHGALRPLVKGAWPGCGPGRPCLSRLGQRQPSMWALSFASVQFALLSPCRCQPLVIREQLSDFASQLRMGRCPARPGPSFPWVCQAPAVAAAGREEGWLLAQHHSGGVMLAFPLSPFLPFFQFSNLGGE